MPFQIINETKAVTLAKNALLADTPLSRIRGLLGRRSLAEDSGLIIRPCKSIHTFFMQFPIDALFVSRNNKIVKIISRMAPFRVSAVCWKADFVVELPAGRAKETSSQPGDIISISP